MYAVIKTGGKQYKVRVGETIDVEKLAVEDGAQVRLDQVLLASNDGDVAFGRPLIDGAVVTARAVRQHKGPKLIIFKYKSKSRYRRRTGHRQPLTQLAIQSIEVPGWETVRIEPPVARAVSTAVEAPAASVMIEEPITSRVMDEPQAASAPVASAVVEEPQVASAPVVADEAAQEPPAGTITAEPQAEPAEQSGE